ncbi:pimeloyl-ACP methyl ester esterase BioH [Thiorhodospira sibirica]|uniref:pimeloyl-ACP methyl ester esterase BioH n=1 Tax=Thiorhodospira sibirica TaxID=154347 RepID=UPI00022C22DF|nr:pimeloyl-ACP methyl ester esterase BioH [Thiorhodospira sibirica]
MYHPLEYAIDCGRGPPVTLLHGWGMQATIFAPLAQRLKHRYHLRALDLPGYGLNRHHPSPATLSQLAAVIAPSLPPAGTVVGWSMGGLVALHIAQQHPGSVQRLILLASSPCFVTRPDWPCALQPEALAAFANDLQHGYALTLKRFLALQFHGIADAATQMRRLRAQLDTPPADPAILEIGLHWLSHSDARAILHHLPMPVGLIFGEYDRLVPIASADLLQAHSPHLAIRRIAGAGHIPFLTHSDAFDHAFNDLLLYDPKPLPSG